MPSVHDARPSFWFQCHAQMTANCSISSCQTFQFVQTLAQLACLVLCQVLQVLVGKNNVTTYLADVVVQLNKVAFNAGDAGLDAIQADRRCSRCPGRARIDEQR